MMPCHARAAARQRADPTRRNHAPTVPARFATSSTFVWRPQATADRRQKLRLASPGRREPRYEVRLVGMLDRQRFVVTHPRRDGALVFVREGDHFDVSAFDGARVRAFDSVVAAVHLGDSPSLELSLPSPQARRHGAIRRAQRQPMALPCSVRYGDVGWELRSGYIADLNHLGAKVALELPLPTGVEQVRVAFRVEVLGKVETVHMHARIRSTSQDPRPDMPATLYGLQFEQVSEQHALLVHGFVLERLLASSDDIFGWVS